MEFNNSSFFIDGRQGEKVEFDILFVFEHSQTGKKYVAFTPHKKSDSETYEVYAAAYHDTDNGMELSDIETDEEWKLIEQILDNAEAAIEQHDGNPKTPVQITL